MFNVAPVEGPDDLILILYIVGYYGRIGNLSNVFTGGRRYFILLWLGRCFTVVDIRLCAGDKRHKHSKDKHAYNDSYKCLLFHDFPPEK